MKNIKVPILIISVIFGGIFLIYFVSSQFFTQNQQEFTVGSVDQAGKSFTYGTEYEASDFDLLDLKGEKIKLSDFHDKIVILNFWTTWNPAAKDQLAILDNYYQKNKNNKDIVLLAVNSQEDESVVSNFIKRGEYVLPVLLDGDGRVGEIFEIGALPATYFIDKDNFIKEIYIGVMNEEMIQDGVNRLF